MISFKTGITISFSMCFWLSLAINISAQVAKPVYKIYPVAELKSDFTFMYHTLINGNPGAYRFISPQKLDSVYTAIYAHIQHDETAIQFIMHCDSMVAAIRCGHTGMEFGKTVVHQVAKYNIYKWALSTLLIQNKWFIYKSLLKNDSIIKAGDEIVSINNIQATEIISKTKSLIPPDGYSNTSKTIHGSPYMTYIFMTQYWNHKDTLYFELTDTVGHKKYDTISLTKLINPDNNKEPLSAKDTLFTILTNNIPKKKKKALFFVSPKSTLKVYKNDTTTAIMEIPEFMANSTFINQSFKIISQKKISSLVLDLRGNPGGEISEAVLLLSYLLDSSAGFEYKRTLNPLSSFSGMKHRWLYSFIEWSFSKIYTHKDSAGMRTYTLNEIKPVKQYHYNGQLIVLINGGSFSASCIVSSYLKNAHRAVFIGRETGGAQYGCNAVIVPEIKLPHTPLLLRLPLYSILYNVRDKGNGRGIMPDIPIIYTIQNIIQHIDPDLNKALSVLKNGMPKTQLLNQ